MRKLFLCTIAILVAASEERAHAQINPAPTRVVGHARVDLVSRSPNLVEEKDLFGPTAIAADTSMSPPALYVADTNNNRVLGWRSAALAGNGAPADIVIGQRDFNRTLPEGPAGSLSIGLSSPVALAVDRQGNLYVADAGNNRILRYKTPFQQTESLKEPDMVIGQPNREERAANNGGVSEKSIALTRGGALLRSGLAFDSSGNLWFSDSGNNRILRYSSTVLQAGRNQPAADAVLGQASFNTVANPPGDPRNKTLLNLPSAIAFDPSGRLYVCDVLTRVLVYASPRNLATADRIMGVVVLQAGQTAPPAVNNISLGRLVNGRNIPPEGIFFIGTTPFVVDTANSRILRFDPYESWPPEATQFSPTARQVIGQPDFTTFRPNYGRVEPNAEGFNSPLGGTLVQGNVFLADAGNNRVMSFPVQNGTITVANYVLGQNELYQGAPNNVDGRELFFADPQGGASVATDGAGIAIDNSSSPPRLYISDTKNNRILGFSDARRVKQGDRADLVIGQRDLKRTLVNDPANSADQVTETGLNLPANIAVDAAGNLYIADSGNGRVVRYPRPFDQTAPLRPDLVLGQPDFNSHLTDASSRIMDRPYGIAFTQAGHLLVSDVSHNRVLFFRKPEGGDFTRGMAAEKVIGQSDFVTTTSGSVPNRMSGPRGIATDTDDRLYVCDTENNRLLIYDTIVFSEPDPFPALPLPGFNKPYGIYVSPNTGKIWIANTGAGQVLSLPVYFELLFGATAGTGFTAFLPLALTLDATDNLFVADANNRVTLHFPALQATNGGHQLTRLAPYTYTTLRPSGANRLAEASVNYKDEPDAAQMPFALGDVEVLVADQYAPIQSVSPDKIEIVLPKSVSPGNNIPVVVQRLSTGSIVAAGSLSLASTAPAFFTVSGEGGGQILAKNPGGTTNSAADRVARGETISLLGTGFGTPAGIPEDGVPAADKVEGVGSLVLTMGTRQVNRENITYFGLAPGLVAVWQIDVKVPDSVPPDPDVLVGCIFNSTPCNFDGIGPARRTTIAVKASPAGDTTRE